MPDWAPVPNLPSVQATVASAQPAHLSGVDHIDPDGFGRGFTSVMNMRKTLGEMELGKLIQEATDDKGVIHWDQFNSLAKKGSPNLRLLLGDYAPRVQSMEDAQSDHATELANQNAANEMLFKKGLIDKNQRDATQSTLESRRISGGIPFIGQNPQALIDAGNKTMLQPLADFHLGNKEERDFQNINGQNSSMTRTVGVSPNNQAEINSNLAQIPYTNPFTNEKELATVQKNVDSNANVKFKKIANENTALSKVASDFDQQRQDWAIHKAPEFNRNMLNVDSALDALNNSKDRSTWDPDIVKFKNILGIMGSNDQLTQALANKDIAALKNVEKTNAHIQATDEALGGSVHDPRLREYALYLMAKNYLLNAMEGIRMQNSNQKEYGEHNYGQVGGAPAVADMMIMHALKQRHPHVYNDIVQLNKFLNSNYVNEYNNQRAIQRNAAQKDPYWNGKLGDLQNRLEIK